MAVDAKLTGLRYNVVCLPFCFLSTRCLIFRLSKVAAVFFVRLAFDTFPRDSAIGKKNRSHMPSGKFLRTLVATGLVRRFR
jgi:hypothetical protein